MDNNKLGRAIDDINNSYVIALEEEFKSHIDSIKDILIKSYDDLSSYRTEGFSHFDIALFRDKFIEVINNFNFIVKSDVQVSLVTPDIENFDFSELKLLHQILEGTVGIYFEISQDDLALLSISSNSEPINVGQDKYYLVEYSNTIELNALNVLKKRLTIFPFSQTPALERTLFDRVENYVNLNFDSWISNALERSGKLVKNHYRGI